MFSEPLRSRTAAMLEAYRTRGLKIATAESCTGGLIAALITEIPGSSDVFERGFVTYTNEAKMEMLEVSRDLIETHGAVSEQVARAMAAGALNKSNADVSIAITGIAGPTGGSATKPVGLVHLASSQVGKRVLHMEHMLRGTRDEIRLSAVELALALLNSQLRG